MKDIRHQGLGLASNTLNVFELIICFFFVTLLCNTDNRVWSSLVIVNVAWYWSIIADSAAKFLPAENVTHLFFFCFHFWTIGS